MTVGSRGALGCIVVWCHVNSTPSNASMCYVTDWLFAAYKYSIVSWLIAIVQLRIIHTCIYAYVW